MRKERSTLQLQTRIVRCAMHARTWLTGVHPGLVRSIYVAAFLAAVASVGQTNCLGPSAGGVNSTATCLGCHNGGTAQSVTSILVSAHANVGCVTCHGDGTTHVRSGGEGGLFLNPSVGPFPRSYASCVQCHSDTVNQFLESGHAMSQAVSCHDCHDVHAPAETSLPKNNNLLCQSCHGFFEFRNDAAISAHTMHDVDPAGTGASRCTECHLPPLDRFDQAEGPHDHSLHGIAPQTSIDAITNGVMPVPPNSCAGITGCHDGTVATAPMFNVENQAQLAVIQGLFELWFGTP